MKAIKEIKTEGGWIRGKACENGYAFLGIPYAAPPVGELRWRHPQPVIPRKISIMYPAITRITISWRRYDG